MVPSLVLPQWPMLENPRISQSILKDGLLDCGEYRPNTGRVGRLGNTMVPCQLPKPSIHAMGKIRLLRVKVQVRPIDLLEFPVKELDRSLYVGTATVVREVVFYWGTRNFFLEKIAFVEKKDDASPEEPPRIHHGIK